MSERFLEFFKELIINEGGFSDDPRDKGGKTIYGITLNNYPETYNLVYNLYMDGKKQLALNSAQNFYYNEFYNKFYDDIKDINLAFKVFDFGVNAGVKRAVKFLQEVLRDLGNDLEVDGIFGANTLRLTNTFDLYEAYINKLEAYYISLNEPTFIKGWLNRLKRKFS